MARTYLDLTNDEGDSFSALPSNATRELTAAIATPRNLKVSHRQEYHEPPPPIPPIHLSGPCNYVPRFYSDHRSSEIPVASWKRSHQQGQQFATPRNLAIAGEWYRGPDAMASPVAADAPNGVSTPPNNTQATTLGGPSPPTTQTSANEALSAPVPPNAALPAEASTSLKDDGLSTKRPRDARLIHLLLAAQGVQAYQERVPLMIMDFAYRYTSSILSDAFQFSNDGYFKTQTGRGAEKEPTITLDHLRLSISARQHFQFQPSLPKDYLAQMAAEKNKVALPKPEREFGYRLPPEKYTFTGVGWGLKEEWDEEVEEGYEGQDETMKDVAVEGGNAEDQEVDQDEFEEAMGTGQDTAMEDA